MQNIRELQLPKQLERSHLFQQWRIKNLIKTLDNQETPIKITLSSTPEIKVTNKNLNGIDINKNGPANDSHLKKMEEHMSQQYDQAALTHSKNQIINEISKENCKNKLKNKEACT